MQKSYGASSKFGPRKSGGFKPRDGQKSFRSYSNSDRPASKSGYGTNSESSSDSRPTSKFLTKNSPRSSYADRGRTSSSSARPSYSSDRRQAPSSSRPSFNDRSHSSSSLGRPSFEERGRTTTSSSRSSYDDRGQSSSTSRPSYSDRSQSSSSARSSYSSSRPSYAGQSSSSSRPSYGDRGRNSGSSFGRNFSSQNSRPGFRSASSRPPRGKGRFSENIDISKLVRKAADRVEEKPAEITNSFADFNLIPELQANIKHRKFVKPTPIQDQSINYIIEGRDIIGLANTGTGKTGAFLLPMINKVFKDKSQKVLILAPTRELALQIEEEFRQFAWSMKLFSAVCVGGAPIHKQISSLRREPNFVIGTPGRLKDLSERNLVKFESFNNIVIDEIDRMLDMGFVDEIKAILAKLPSNKQSLFFSATMPTKIRDLVHKFLNDPVTVEIESSETADHVDQDIIRVRNSEMKFNQLQELLHQDDLKKVLIFSETKRDVEKLTSNLIHEGFKADSIHGDKKQHQRQRALSLFKNDTVNILVATDVAARGLDIQDVSHVINYTMPQTYTDYIHRIGRTGRGDKKGMALTFVEGR